MSLVFEKVDNKRFTKKTSFNDCNFKADGKIYNVIIIKNMPSIINCNRLGEVDFKQI